MPNGKAKYSIDSSSLIHAWRRAYPPEHFKSFWQKIEELVDSGVIVASIEVLHELKKKDDDLRAWAVAQNESLFIEIDDEQQGHLAHIMGTYPRLVDTAKGRSEGDPFVIALARHCALTVISEEQFGKRDSPKIPNVCQAEGINCYKLVDLIRSEGWVF